MVNGWLVMVDGKNYRVGVATQEEAQKLVEALGVRGRMGFLPLKDGESERLGLADGEVRQET